MTEYENFVINQTRRIHTPRTLTEAFRGADYGTAIWRCEQKKEGWSAFVIMEAVIMLGTMFAIGVLLAPHIS